MRLNRQRCRLLKKRTRELPQHARQSALQMLSVKPWVKSTKRQNRFLSIVPVNSHAQVSSKRSKLRPVTSKSKPKSSRTQRPARAAAQVAQARQHQVKLQVQLSKPLRPPRLLRRILQMQQLSSEKGKISDLITE